MFCKNVTMFPVPRCQATARTLFLPSGSAWLWGEIWRTERCTYRCCLVPPSVISWHWFLVFSSAALLSNQPPPTACSVRVTRPPPPSLPPETCGKSTDSATWLAYANSTFTTFTTLALFFLSWIKLCGHCCYDNALLMAESFVLFLYFMQFF